MTQLSIVYTLAALTKYWTFWTFQELMSGLQELKSLNKYDMSVIKDTFHFSMGLHEETKTKDNDVLVWVYYYVSYNEKK